MPTQNQLNARLNPTQINYTLPTGQGFFRGANDPTSLFKYESNGGFTPFSLVNFGRDQLGATGNAQAQSNAAIQHLKSQYGLDFNSLPEVNMGDLQQQLGARGIQGGQQFAGDLTSFLGATPKAAPVQAQPENQPLPAGTPGAAPATPAQIAEQQKNPDFLGGKVGTLGQQKTPQANGSIVDFLNQKGQASDFASRAKLAQEMGIKNYTGTVAQNTALLNTLSSKTSGNDNPSITTPSGKVGESGTLGASGAGGAGISPIDKYANLDPVQKQVQMYTDSYKALGLQTIKDQSDTFTKQLGEIQKEMQDKIGKVQANPWLSQGIADRTVERIQKDYASRIDMLTHLQTLTDSMYKTGLAQVDHLVSDANADIRATNELAQKTIDAAQALAKDNQVVSIGGREVLVNKQTGRTVADLGATTHFAGQGSQGDYTDVKEQNKLENQFRQALLKEVSNRSGGLGLQDAKVNQAVHLKALLEQYKDSRGNYNVPRVQYVEIAMGLANLVAPTGQVSDSAREAILQRTASGDIRGALTYITGTPFHGSTQAVFKNLADSIDRQGQVSQELRDKYVGFLRGLAPTGLDPTRIDALTKNNLASFTDKKSLNSNPSQFNNIKSSITINGQNAYIPRAVWASLGDKKDALLAEAKADGYTLLVK